MTEDKLTTVWQKVTNAYDFFPHGDSRHYWYFQFSKIINFNQIQTIKFSKKGDKMRLKVIQTQSHLESQ